MNSFNVGFQKAYGIHTVSLLLFLSLVYICILTLMPFTFSFEGKGALVGNYESRFGGLSPYCCTPAWSPENVISNLLLFVPFGMFLVALRSFSLLSLCGKIVLAGIASGIVSSSVELLQLFLPRHPSLVDVMFNTVSGMIGGLVGHYFFVPMSQLVLRFWGSGVGRRVLVLGVMVYVLFVVLIYVLPIKSNFRNWDSSFLFQVGNEATQDFPWVGKIYQIAVYERSLDASEVLLNFHAGPFVDKAHFRVHNGLLAFYNFSEGSGEMVHDRGPVGPLLDLHITNVNNIKWLTPNGLELLEATTIRSQEPFRKIYNSSGYVNSEVTIEVWVSPSDTTQKGPARIISYSQDPNATNFLLGQEKQNMVFRLRTPITGKMGTEPELYTTDSPLGVGVQHIVATYRPGYETLYLNGKKHKMIRVAKKKYIFEYLEKICGRYAYSFFLLFPLGFFSYLGFSYRKNDIIVPTSISFLIGVGVLGIIWGVPLFTVWMRGLDYSLLIFGGMVVVVSVLTSMTFQRTLANPSSF
jgi:glycopeptide antibiotics resistance protein